MNKDRNGRYTPPAPNLRGNYRDSCIVCRTGTDSGVGFRGPAEWALAGIRTLGVPKDEAAVVLVNALNDGLPDESTHFAPGKVPIGEFTAEVRVCGSCVESSGAPFTVAPVALGVPVYEYRGE